jgi:CO/xanthine dehydrogenase Mo-binding subunit
VRRSARHGSISAFGVDSAIGAAIGAAVDAALGRRGGIDRLPITPQRLHAMIRRL